MTLWQRAAGAGSFRECRRLLPLATSPWAGVCQVCGACFFFPLFSPPLSHPLPYTTPSTHCSFTVLAVLVLALVGWSWMFSAATKRRLDKPHLG